ncbi:MAG: right-handed parallel beta-helix repeat-containing protein, partial [Dokdonella sp.]
MHGITPIASRMLPAAIASSVRRAPSVGARHPLLTGVAAIGLALGGIDPVAANVFTVTANGDPGTGSLSLRQAIAMARTGSGNVVDFDAALIGSTITLTQGELVVDKSMAIIGPGADKLTISGGNASSVFNLSTVVTSNFPNVTIANLAITGGLGSPSRSLKGAAIYVFDEALVLQNSVISGSSSCFSAISIEVFQRAVAASTVTDSIIRDNGCRGLETSSSHLSITDSIISGNTSAGPGAGIATSKYSAVNISRSTISGNVASGRGGGISAPYGAALSIESSRITGNISGQSGGAIYLGNEPGYSAGTLTLDRTTISGNSAAINGSGIAVNHPGSVAVRQSLISGNLSSNAQAGGAGGGLSLQAVTGQTSIENSTFHANYAGYGGGIAILDAATGDHVRITNSTITGNATPAYDQSNGILGMGQPTLYSCIVANNVNRGGTNEDMAGDFVVKYSLIKNPVGATMTGVFNITGADPQLGPLADNGGPTLTMLPTVTSP